MKNKRLLHITSSLQMGGAEQALFQLIRSLENDFDHVVICFHSGPFVERIRELGVPVYHVHGYFSQYDPIFLVRLYRLVKKLKPGRIHSLLWFANMCSRIVGRLLGIPVVCAIHSPLNTNKGTSVFRSFIDHLTMTWAARTVFIARHIKDDCKFVPSAKTSLIVNGVDFEWLLRRAKERPIEKMSGDFIIGTVGRLVTIKNQRLLLQLIKRLETQFPNVKLLIIGSGQLRSQLMQEAHDLGILEKVTILEAEATFYYSIFDIFILPSFAEGLSMALLEAMSFSLPVLMANIGEENEVIVNDYNGFLFSPYDIEQLEKYVISLIINKDLRVRLGRMAVNTVKRRFAMSVAAQAYKKLFDEITLF